MSPGGDGNLGGADGSGGESETDGSTTGGNATGGNATGGSGGTSDELDCDDGLACTQDYETTSGTCLNLIAEATCRIGDKCFESGDENPDNPCESCDPDEADDGWTPRENGTACGHCQTCDSGVCGPDPTCCSASAINDTSCEYNGLEDDHLVTEGCSHGIDLTPENWAKVRENRFNKDGSPCARASSPRSKSSMP